MSPDEARGHNLKSGPVVVCVSCHRCDVGQKMMLAHGRWPPTRTKYTDSATLVMNASTRDTLMMRSSPKRTHDTAAQQSTVQQYNSRRTIERNQDILYDEINLAGNTTTTIQKRILTHLVQFSACSSANHRDSFDLRLSQINMWSDHPHSCRTILPFHLSSVGDQTLWRVEHLARKYPNMEEY